MEPPPGKKLVWEVWEHGRHRGWLGLGEPAFKLAARRVLGLADGRPAPHTVCNFIFRLERGGEARASDILKAWHTLAARDWASKYGWVPAHWETLIDPAAIASPVIGACYRRAGYRSIGPTTGRGARRPVGHGHQARVWGPTSVKVLFYRGPLVRSA